MASLERVAPFGQQYIRSHACSGMRQEISRATPRAPNRENERENGEQMLGSDRLPHVDIALWAYCRPLACVRRHC